jgi:Xaa-Pro aminopeptidase
LKRINTLKQVAFRKDGFNGFLIFNSVNLTYFTGFAGASALLIPEDGESTAYVYGVNFAHAKAELNSIKAELVERGENLMDKIANQAKAFKIRKLAVDALNIENWRALTRA